MLALVLALFAVEPASQGPNLQEQALGQLLVIRRVYVDRLTGGETAAQMRDMIISSFQNSNLFVITENQERADAVLRGAAEDMVFTDVHSSSESLSVRGQAGNSRSSTEKGYYGSFGAGQNESTRSVERKHEAMATVRLVNKDGDVIWSTTQESLGGKFRGASADVADKITKRLLEDYAKAKKLSAVSTPPSAGR